MATTSKMWFHDDLIALKDNPVWIGMVKRSSEDVDEDSHSYFPIGINTLFHKQVPMKVRNEYTKSGKPTRGYVVVRFPHRIEQNCLVHESSITLLERAFSFGDVVKRKAGDAISGTVIHTAVECTLQSPIHTDARQIPGISDDKGPKSCFRFPSPFRAPDANRFSDREYIRGVPAEELMPAATFAHQRFIIYREWVGVIEDVVEAVTIRLSNGALVQVEDPFDLEVPIDPAEVKKYFSRRTTNRAPSDAGKSDKSSENNADKHRYIRSVWTEQLALGQFVTSPLANIRDGKWKKGAFDENIDPDGYVVEISTTALRVRWVFQNILNPKGTTHHPAPPGYLKASELKPGKFHVYDRERQPRDHVGPKGMLFGYGHGSSLTPADYVRFRDLAKASKKYDGQNGGKVTVIPSSKSEGYDVNTFKVMGTRTKVTVQWQDLSVTTQDSPELIPYLNADDLEVWPGEYVAVKGPKASPEDLRNDPDRRKPPSGSNYTQEEWNKLRNKSIGVAQSVDAGERVARVRWFLDINELPAGSEEASQRIVVPGAYLAKEEECSLYELRSVPMLSMRRGDIVSIESGFATGIPKRKARAAIDWFGELVDLRLDGLVTVRLGALETVQDVIVPAQRVLVVYGEDDDEDDDNNEEDEGDWKYPDESDSIETVSGRNSDIIEEVVEYEGGIRLDPDGGDDVWSTADDDEGSAGDSEDKDGSEDIESGEEDADMREEHDEKSKNVPDDGGSTRTNEPALDKESSTTVEAKTNAYREAPKGIAKFAVLDGEPPSDHAFLDEEPSDSPALTKRIWKEFLVLETSLPDWVFVRTWDSRIDLVRTLIIGPQHTPYALAPFIIDLHFPPSYPYDPPEASFHSWTGGVGKVNPNLYEDGTICLSLLGTWPGKGNVEGWVPAHSSLLQILVSILGLVLVKEPYYNEAGYEVLVGTDDSIPGSIQYNERAYILSKNFVKHALRNPVGGFDDVIKTLYLPAPKTNNTNTNTNKEDQDGDEQEINQPNLLRSTIQHGRRVVERSEKKDTPHTEPGAPSSASAARTTTTAADLLEADGVSRVSRGALSFLRRSLGALEGILAGAEKGEAAAAAAGGEKDDGPVADASPGGGDDVD